VAQVINSRRAATGPRRTRTSRSLVHRTILRLQKYYANLGFFLTTFVAPDGASAEELTAYIRMIGYFDAEGAVKPGLRAGLENALREAMKRRF
jgi:hypothetical protein